MVGNLLLPAGLKLVDKGNTSLRLEYPQRCHSSGAYIIFGRPDAFYTEVSSLRDSIQIPFRFNRLQITSYLAQPPYIRPENTSLCQKRSRASATSAGFSSCTKWPASISVIVKDGKHVSAPLRYSTTITGSCLPKI